MLRTALSRLGIDRLVLSIHHGSFPGGGDDVGYGTPHSERGSAFCAWLAQLGFNGIALGPAGTTRSDSPSPYEASALSRNPLHVALAPLVARGLLSESELAAETVPPGDRLRYEHAFQAQRRLLALAADRLQGSELEGVLAARRAALPFLATEARFESLAAAAGHDDFRLWPVNAPQQPQAGRRFEVVQWLADDQHAAFAARARGLGLALYGDLSIGVGHRDRFWLEPLFLRGYAMGAPPSRTNPNGQAWGFPVFDPRVAGAAEFLAMRFARVLDGMQGVRVDHPHGWVCPWVYRNDDPDPVRAVQRGARLHESPDLPDHPELAAFARVRPEQLDRSLPRHHDAWVRELEPDQVAAYAGAIDRIVELARAGGAGPGELMIEVLSTCPRPLAAVLARHGLGRYRVTQKARVDDPGDVYRSDRAAPADWVMIGNHDTPPLRAVIARWRAEAEHPTGGEIARRARFLGERLRLDPAWLAASDEALATALLAELFLGPARNALVFWVDLLGGSESYNRPGEVGGDNWSLRVPPDFEAAHARAVARGEAPRLATALAWALRARGLDQGDEGGALVHALLDGSEIERD
jgi:4-alpha-glucanotransferase